MKIILSLGLLATVSACSFAPIGENSFNCNRGEGSSNIYCRSPKSVLNSTDGQIPDTKYGKSFEMSEYDVAVGYANKPGDNSNDLGTQTKKVSGKEGDLVTSLGLLPHQLVGNNIIDGAPVRAAPVIQRVYIKPWVDENDILHEGSLTYKEVQTAKWTGFDAQAGTANNFAGGKVYPHRPPGSNKALFSETDLDEEMTNGQVSKPFAQPTAPVTTVTVGGQAAPLPAGIGSNDNSMPR